MESSFGHLGDESSLKECQLLWHDNGKELADSIMTARSGSDILLKMLQAASAILICANGELEEWMKAVFMPARNKRHPDEGNFD